MTMIIVGGGSGAGVVLLVAAIGLFFYLRGQNAKTISVAAETENFTFHKETAATSVGIILSEDGGTIRIDQLIEGGLAVGSGLQVGDMVLTINGKRVTRVNAALAEIQRIVGGVTVGIVPRPGGSTRSEPVQSRLPRQVTAVAMQGEGVELANYAAVATPVVPEATPVIPEATPVVPIATPVAVVEQPPPPPPPPLHAAHSSGAGSSSSFTPDPGAKKIFCGECGTNLGNPPPKFCPECGTLAPQPAAPKKKFCGGCGNGMEYPLPAFCGECGTPTSGA